MTAETITFPDTFSGLKALPAEDQRVLSVITLSGKAHGAYYALDGQGRYALRKQASLDNEIPAAFPQTAVFNADVDHIPVLGTDGRMKGFFHLQYPDETARYGADFVRDYWTPPPELQQANREMAALMAAKAAPELFPPTPGQTFAQDTPEQRDIFMGQIAEALARSQTVQYRKPDGSAHALPDDNFLHTRGVASVAELTALAINQTAAQYHDAGLYETPEIFTPAALKGIELMGRVHDIGKVQIRSRLNPFEQEYLTPADRAKSPEEQAAIHRKKDEAWHRVNYLHPLLGYLALSCYPEVAEAFALHHLSLYRDQKNPVDREKNRHLMLVRNDLATPAEVPYVSQIFRVCDVSDAILDHSHKQPADMLRELERMTSQPNHMGFTDPSRGLPSIDPDILCFMIDRGVMDEYLRTKIVSAKSEGAQETRPIITPEYQQLKAEILARHNYAARRGEVEGTILGKVEKEPMLRAFARDDWQRRVTTPRQPPAISALR